MKKVLFSATDPLGNEIKLLKETFEKHIIVRHPEMKNHIQDIKQAVKHPLYIGSGAKSKNSIIYLSVFPNQNTPYIIVAVKRIKKTNKIILTAFSAKNLGLNKINKILWQEKNPKNLIIPTLRPRKN
ncbi:hypothetical protein KAI65_00045 [Candidatus Parcubacteria bacterium]|nr:hypothetical protein [Candidatus Parcubacteria bacterium]